IVRTGVESEALRQLVPSFESETGIHVQLIELARESYFSSVSTQLFAGSNAFDLAFIPSTYIAQFSLAKVIQPLDPFIANPELTDLHTLDLKDFIIANSFDNKLYSLPTDVSTHLLYYRSDLISSPPQTWDEVIKLARQFTKSNHPDSATQWGLGITGLATEELPKIFDTILWSFGGDIIDAQGQIALDSKSSIKAGEWLQQLVLDKVVPPDVLSMGFANVREALDKGEIAMAVPYWNAAAGTMNGSGHQGNIKVALVPGIEAADGTLKRSSFQHSWELAINTNSMHPEEAWKFISYATGKQGGKLYAKAGGTPARKSLLSDPDLQKLRPEFSLVMDSMQISRNEPIVSYYPLMINIQNEALTQILTLHQSPEKALTAAASKLRSLDIHDQIIRMNSKEEHNK
ncbi:MAG: sugar transporter substrate-binding protein, partial [Bacilli bacterium]|nr:sugar transporter substrate-binding protein [Bacilli bacterium]